MPTHEAKIEVLNGAAAAALGLTLTLASTLTGESIIIAPSIALMANAKTGAYTATIIDFFIPVDATAGPITITLPALASVKLTGRGLMLNIKKMDASGNAVTVDGNGAETIDGALTNVLAARYNRVWIIAGPTEWSVL